jgi:hypothetical protein
MAASDRAEVKRQIEAVLLNSECAPEEAVKAALQAVGCFASYEGLRPTLGVFLEWAKDALGFGWNDHSGGS